MQSKRTTSPLRTLFAGQLMLLLTVDTAAVFSQLRVHTWVAGALLAVMLAGYAVTLFGYWKLRPLHRYYQTALVMCVCALYLGWFSTPGKLVALMFRVGQIYLVIQATNALIPGTDQELQKDSRNILLCCAAAVVLTVISSIAALSSNNDISAPGYGIGVILGSFSSLALAVAGFLYLIYLWQRGKPSS